MTVYIHCDEDSTLYSVTEDELNSLVNKSQPLWKDVCLVSGSIGIPSLINFLSAIPTPFKITLSLFLNALFGILGIVFAIIFGIAWKNTRNDTKEIIAKVKAKPKRVLQVGTTDVGPLSES
jgi:hypothetical protein